MPARTLIQWEIKVRLIAFSLLLSIGLTFKANADQIARNHILQVVNSYAVKHQLEPALVVAIIKVESDFEPYAISNKGAVGLMQLMPITQREVGVINPFDVEANINGGCIYLNKMLLKFGSIEKALWAYNAGPARVINNQKPLETRKYVRRVLIYYKAIKKSQNQL